ncbi:Panacea domain-containing protein [Paenibacillus sp. BC26]|uniref:Panacea domain-containing protein n=1 Tax=Paenibacillus sp. BC26 TaxID=1881032 RepID=UPI0008E3AED6|nr:type II toxin-antitoxin system antitoxin SocA domain-containing protein [Paenibacillus sp. BC26]SFS77614.1 Uncharacterized phage-associated protein [Paenibacillus sp. BC26]
MKVSVSDVADYLLQKSNRNSNRSITHLKLQKLVYYVQAWHTAIKGEPLFAEEIEAWVHGPVCPELYATYKQHGFNEIDPPQTIQNSLSKSQKELIDEVWQMYGGFSGRTLETLTHKEDPWINARGSISEHTPSNSTISIDSMGKYYKKLLEGN